LRALAKLEQVLPERATTVDRLGPRVPTGRRYWPLPYRRDGACSRRGRRREDPATPGTRPATTAAYPHSVR
jgi:hypothetical protein